MKKLTLPLSDEEIRELKSGEALLLSGKIYTARDCAHKRIFEYLDEGKDLPFTLKNAYIYYAGPCPNKPDKASGSCGPTTSARMNKYAPRLLNLGLGGMIGKGEMSDEVKSALVKNKRAYFAAIGGAGALYGNCVISSRLIGFEDLLSEAIYELEVKDFPVVVAIDSDGNSVY